MKILETSEYYFEFLGVSVVNRGRRLDSIKSCIKSFYYVSLMTVLFVTSAIYIYYNHDQIVKCMTAIMTVCATLSITGQFLFLKLNDDRIKELLWKYRVMVNEGLFSQKTRVLVEIENIATPNFQLL